MDLPIGSIILFDGATLPAGWYDCDGSTHSGIATPNLISKFPKGVPSGGTLGAAGGASTHTHANANTGETSHGHGAKNATTSQPSGDVGVWGQQGSGAYQSVSHTHTITINAVASGSPHAHAMPTTDAASSLPPNIRLRYIMRCE